MTQTSSLAVTKWLVGTYNRLSDADTLEEAFHAVMESMQDLFACQSLAVLLRDENTNAITIQSARNVSYSFVKSCARGSGGLVIPRVLLKHETMRFAGLAPSDPRYAEIKLEHDFRAACLTPVLQNRRAIGYLHCDRADDRPFTDEESDCLQVLGHIAGRQVDRIELLALSRHMARMDEASQALKYRAFLEDYNREIVRAKAYRSPLSLLFLHIDNYTKFMATCGVPAGHALLTEVNRLIREQVREIDLIGRFSAAEFIVCLCGMTRQESEEKAEAIRRAVEQRAAHGAGCPVTLSGVAMTFERGADLDISFHQVLTALGSGLITVQSEGRNRMATIDPPRG